MNPRTKTLLEQVELWPSVGEYQVYDEILYYARALHEQRHVVHGSYQACTWLNTCSYVPDGECRQWRIASGASQNRF